MNYIQLRAANHIDKLMGVKYAGLGGMIGKLWSGTGGKLLNWVGNKVTGVANKGFQKWGPNISSRVTPNIGARVGSSVTPSIGGRVMEIPGANSNFYNYAQRGLNWMGRHPQIVGGMTLGGIGGGAYAGYRNRPQSQQIPMPTSRPSVPQTGVPQYPNYY